MSRLGLQLRFLTHIFNVQNEISLYVYTPSSEAINKQNVDGKSEKNEPFKESLFARREAHLWMRWRWSRLSRERLVRGDDGAISRGARRLAEFSQSVFSYRGDSAIWSAGYRAGYRDVPGDEKLTPQLKAAPVPRVTSPCGSFARLALREKKYGASQKYRDHGGAQHRCRWVILLNDRSHSRALERAKKNA